MYQIYQVGPNETLESIADNIGIDIFELRRLNGISDNAAIRTGSYIIVPNNNISPINNTNYKKYIVKKGDSIYSIARNNDVDFNTLLALNGLNKTDYIYPNQEIIIPTNRVYITKENDTVYDIMDKFNLDLNDLKDLLLVQDQTIIY